MVAREAARLAANCALLMSSAKDTRLMVVYGYARLVAYDPNLEIVPDIVERVDVEDNRSFHLPSAAGP